jgi:hypothetical protein
MSIHEPADAASWIEDNWDKPLVAFIRDHGYGGPIAWMLSPEESALAIFGSYDDPMVANMAKELADLSGFTAVVRPPDDNPALCASLFVPRSRLRFSARTGGTDHHNGYVQFNNVGGDNDDRVGDSEDEGESMPEDERSPAESTGNGGRRNNDFVAAEFDGDGLNAAVPETKPDGIGLGGGDGGGGEPTTVDGQWDSPLHRTRVTLQLKVSTAHIYPVTIGCNYRVNCILCTVFFVSSISLVHY